MVNMTDYLAVGIAEGFELPESEEQLQEAWQHIYDIKIKIMKTKKKNKNYQNGLKASCMKKVPLYRTDFLEKNMS
jgi:hypothetical protein